MKQTKPSINSHLGAVSAITTITKAVRDKKITTMNFFAIARLA